MRQIPLDSGPKASLERMPRLPSQFPANLRGIDGVPAIVTRSIGDERLQRVVRVAIQRRIRTGRVQLLEDVTQPLDNLEVGPLVATADIVLFAGSALLQYEQQAVAVILDMQPVPDVQSI